MGFRSFHLSRGFAIASILLAAGLSTGASYGAETSVQVSNHPVFRLAKTWGDRPITRGDIGSLEREALRDTDANGKVTPSLQAALTQIENDFRPRFDAGASAAFQSLVAEVGGKLTGPIEVPENNVPYWLKDPGPLDHYRSSAKLPEVADYVVIGAGLTGAAAARTLAAEAAAGKTVVVLEKGDRPASGASGRNGGNVEMMAENYFDDYLGVVEMQKTAIRNRFPDLPAEVVNAQAVRQSKYLLRFYQANVAEVQKRLKEDSIDADASLKGWLRIAETKQEEDALATEVKFTNQLGMKFEIWSPARIKAATGIDSKLSGRFIEESGNYHPFKYVNGVLQAALKRGVKLYTGIDVQTITKLPDGTHLVKTPTGEIRAKKVVMATNAYSRLLFPQMDYLEPRISHILDFSHVPDEWNGMSVTMKKGDWYAQFPKQDRYENALGEKRGTLHVGGGLDTPIDPAQILEPPFMNEIYHQVRGETEARVKATAAQPPTRSWSGLMGFTADRAPVLSFLYEGGKVDKGIVFAVAFNGYGGSQCAIAGKLAAEMAVSGETPEMLPDDIFSMRRFSSAAPIFPGTVADCVAEYLRKP